MSEIDFSKSNFILMIGGQILLIVIVLLVMFFGANPKTYAVEKTRAAIDAYQAYQASHPSIAPKQKA